MFPSLRRGPSVAPRMALRSDQGNRQDVNCREPASPVFVFVVGDGAPGRPCRDLCSMTSALDHMIRRVVVIHGKDRGVVRGGGWLQD